MYKENLVILFLEAVRVWLYMRCLHTCIGGYKVSKRMIAVVFAAFWGAGSLMEICVPVSMAVESAPAHYAVDLIFLLGVSFFCYGTAGRRVLTAALVPAAYWMGKWTIIFSLFQSIMVSKQQLLIGTAVAVGAFFFLELLIERIRKSRQEQERELLEQEIRIYENQFQVIHQSQQLVRSLKHDMKHHIKMLTDMISDGEKDAVLEYLSSMGAFMENAKEYVASGNERIDSILNYMISRGKTAGIAVDWKIQIPEQLEITGTAVLGTQILSDRVKKEKQVRILRQLGMSDAVIARQRRRQIGMMFLFPFLPAFVCSSAFVYICARKIEVSAFRFPVFAGDFWIGQSVGISLLVFLCFYGIYFLLCFFIRS